MTTPRQSYLNGRVLALCGPDGRLVPPRGMGPQAQNDEIAALCRALDRLAPASGYEAWWRRFEDALLAAATTRSWPLIGEVERAAKVIRDSDRSSHVSAPPAKTDFSEIHQAQLLRWCQGGGPCADHLINRENLEVLARSGRIASNQVTAMLAFAAEHYGITDEADRIRKIGGLPPPLVAGGTHQEIIARNAAIGDGLRGTGIRNPAFSRAAE